MGTDWVAAELATVDLGDARRTRRLAQVLRALAAQPTASVPQACGDWASTKAAYRFWDNPQVEPAAIRAAQQAATVTRAQPEDCLLVAQDTTQLDYRHHPTTTGLGPLAQPAQQGLLVHSALAISLAGVPLGVVHQAVWTRDPAEVGKRYTRRQRPTAEKESQRWLTALSATEAALPPTIQVITVADREADLYDLFAQPRRPGSDLLIRAAHDRAVAHEAGHLVAAVTQAPVLGQHTLIVGRRPDQPPRQATLSVQAVALTLVPPLHHLERSSLAPVPVTVLLAQEPTPPAEVTPLRWLLVTTLPVASVADAQRVLGYYSRRWLLERYHFVLKSGCRLQELQLQTGERLERAVATYSLVAWRLLWLTYQARATPEGSCEPVLARHAWQALACTIHTTPIPPAEPPSLQQAVRWIAQVGGFLGRRADGEPGVATLWRGWRRLEDIAATWLLLHPAHDLGNA